MSSKQMRQCRQTTACRKCYVWHEESQDGRDQQNAGDDMCAAAAFLRNSNRGRLIESATGGVMSTQSRASGRG